jgi:hypothetical protein
MCAHEFFAGEKTAGAMNKFIVGCCMQSLPALHGTPQGEADITRVVQLVTHMANRLTLGKVRLGDRLIPAVNFIHAISHQLPDVCARGGA